MSEETTLTPITPEEAGVAPPKINPFNPVASAPAAAPAPAPAPAADPAAAPAPTAGTTTIKLKPVIRRPTIRKPVVGGARPAPAAPAAEAKKTTQNLKSLTGPIPAQATLRKTGIIAEGILTPAQQQAAKSKTSRISLESAIGVAPVKEAPAPLKTIRLRRPVDLKTHAPSPVATAIQPAPDAPAAEAVPPAAPAPAEEEAGVTQKKTLKLHRPGSVGIKRPSMGISNAAAPQPQDGEVKDMSADMAPVPELKPLAALDGEGDSSSTVAGVPGWVATISMIVSLAALVAIGVTLWYFWQEGVGMVAGANEMQFLQM